MYPVLRRFRQTRRERFRSYLRDPGMTNGLETILVKRSTGKRLNGGADEEGEMGREEERERKRK